jgi:hypothetical protein
MVALQEQPVCMSTPACYQAALDQHLQLLPDEQAALQLLHQQPGTIDAVVVFPRAIAAAAATASAAGNFSSAGISCNSSSSCGSRSSELQLLLEYNIRMNHTQVPLTRALFDTLSVSPGTVDNPWSMLR